MIGVFGLTGINNQNQAAILVLIIIFFPPAGTVGPVAAQVVNRDVAVAEVRGAGNGAGGHRANGAVNHIKPGRIGLGNGVNPVQLPLEMGVVAGNTVGLPVVRARTGHGAGVGVLEGNSRLRTVVTLIANPAEDIALAWSQALVGGRIPPPQGITVAGGAVHTIDAVMRGIDD